MNISKFTKPVLWVIMLSACAQTLPMTRLAANPRLLRGLGNGVAVGGPSVAAAAGATKFASQSAQAENTDVQDQNISTEVIAQNAEQAPSVAPQVEQNLPEEVQNVATENVVPQEQPVEQPLTAVSTPETSQDSNALSNVSEAQKIAQEATEEFQTGNVTDPKELGTTVEELTKSKTFKELVVEKATDREFLKQGFCGLVTLTSGAYLLHKSGALVKVREHWKISSLTAAGLLAAGGVATYFAPDMMKKVAQATLAGATNPYTATAFAATAGGVYVGSKFENRLAQAGAGLTTAGAIGGLSVAHELGYLEKAKGLAYNGASWVAGQASQLAQDYPTAALALGTVGGITALGGLSYLAINKFCTLSPEKAQAFFTKFREDIEANINANVNDVAGLEKLVRNFEALNMQPTIQMINYVDGAKNYIANKKAELNAQQNQAPVAPQEAQPSMFSKAKTFAGNVASAVKPVVFNKWTLGTGATVALAGLGVYGANRLGYLDLASVQDKTVKGLSWVAQQGASLASKASAKVAPILTNKWVIGTGAVAAGAGLLAGAPYAVNYLRKPAVAPIVQQQQAKVIVTPEFKYTTVRGVNIAVEGNNVGKSSIPAKLLAALKGNADELVQAKALANNDANILNAIDGFMQSNIARTIKGYTNSGRVATPAYYNRVNLSKNAIEALAQACGVEIIFA